MTKASYLFWQRQFANHRWFKYLAEFFGIYVVLCFIALGIILIINPATRAVGLWSLLAFVIAKFAVCDLLALFVNRQRPYQHYDFKPTTFSRLFSLKSKKARSFPSGHIISMAAISTVLFSYDPRLGIAGFIVTVLTAIARVLLGFHYPSDVIIGFVLGLGVGLITLWL